jgi:hypothetical protein
MNDREASSPVEGFQTNANEKECHANGRQSGFSTLFVVIRGPFGLDSR